MDNHTDYFDHLPEEVIQLIFSYISDCKSLVHCMSVSKAFRQQAVHVSSLSIVCPGSFSSYDERLHKIYSMVKAFRNLQSLVVRVGQPKDEPPSWARCMRYAEIGGSVEKFMFMAAKSGDFSELDFTLLGLDETLEADGLQQEDRNRSGPSNSTGVMETDVSTPDLVETSSTSISMGAHREESENRSSEAWSDIESDEEEGQRGGIERHISCEIPNIEDIRSDRKLHGKRCTYSRFTPLDASYLQEPGQRKQLSNFSLRQVIAPSNDVLKRMLPVIHFAIVQGLNELRDAIPAFVAQFPELRSFLLVDMEESITVFMREHHIQEIKALYLQELDGSTIQFKQAFPKVEPCFSGLGQAIKENQAKSSTGKVEEEGHFVGVIDATMFNSIQDVATDNRPSEMSDPRHLEGMRGFIVGDSCTQETEEVSELNYGDGVKGSTLEANNKLADERHDFIDVSDVKERKGKDLISRVNGVCSLRRKKEELHSDSNSMPSSCHLPLPKNFFPKNTGICKGKGKLLDYQDSYLQIEGSSSFHNSLCMDSAMWHDCSCSEESNPAVFENFVGDSFGGCPARHKKSVASEDFVEAQDENLITASALLPSLADLKDGATDVEKQYLGSVDAQQIDTSADETVPGTCTGLCPSTAFVESTCNIKDHDWYPQSVAEPRGDEEELKAVNYGRDTNQLFQFRYVEGWDGELGVLDEDHSKKMKDGHRLKGCRHNKEAYLDLAIKHPSKRCPKFDNFRMRDGGKSLRFSAGIRGDSNLFCIDAAEDIGVQQCSMVIGRAKKEGNEQTCKGGVAHAGRAHDDSPDESCNPGVLCVNHGGTMSGTQTSRDGGKDCDRLGTASAAGLQLDVGQSRSEGPSSESQTLHSESPGFSVERSIESDAWRHAWRERVRRLRDSLRVAPGQEVHEHNQEDRRRSRELLRKRQRAMEKDALSFDYTFWRAEQVSSCNYVMSDISMCIATHAARPLRDADKEVLTQAAIAGPLLVATVSHVNEHYTCHNL